MDILKPSALTSEILNTWQSGVPLVICTDVPRVRKRIDSAGYQEVKINKELSKRLLDIPKDDRPKRVEKTLKGMLNYHVPIFVMDFEMLFDPRYEIDVLRFFCEKARIINVAIRWPGQFTDGKLGSCFFGHAGRDLCEGRGDLCPGYGQPGED